MLGVDVGGTFTDVVSVRDGRIEVTKVPSDADRPAAPVVEGAGGSALEGSEVFNHASTMGLNAVITRRLPKIGFLTTEGHRDMLDRGRVWRPLDGADRSELAALVRRRAPAARPALPPSRSRASGCSPTAASCCRWTRSRRAGSSSSRPLRGGGRRDLPPQLLRQPGARAAAARADHEALGDVAVSISSETSPLAKEYARASTTVIDVFMRLIFTEYAHEIDRGCATSASTASSTSPTAPQRCCRGRRRSSSRSGSSSPDLPRAPSRASASARQRAIATCSAATSAGRRRTSRSSSTGSRSSTTRSSSSTT